MNGDVERPATARRELRVEEVDSIAELYSLRDEMLMLWRADCSATVFQSPYWLFAWLEHIKPEERLSVLVVRSGRFMVGAAPLCLRQTREGVSGLCFIEVGITDYFDLTAWPGYQWQVVEAVFEYLFRRGGWDVLRLEQLRPCSLLLRYPLPPGDTVEAQEVCPVLGMSPSLALRSIISERAFRQLAYYRRRLARTGRVSVESADETNVDAILESLAALHCRRWRARGENGALSGADIMAFHRGVAGALVRERMLRMYLLKFDGRDAAAFYGFHCNNRTMYYLGGFAPEFARLNLGSIIVGHAIERALAEGATEFDFLRGSEPYKFFWGARARLNYRRFIHRNHDPHPAFDHDINPRS